MNDYHQTLSRGQFASSNGQVLSALQELLKESRHIPHPEVSLLWTRRERQRLGYASPDFQYERRVAYATFDNPQSLEHFYINRIHETIVAKLLQEFFKKNDPAVTVYATSDHDDIFS